MPGLGISDVLIIDVSGEIEHRNTKHCVCVSVSKNKYFMINTKHREMYDDFEIESSEYGFLNGVNRFVSCSLMREFDVGKIIRKVGNLSKNDMRKIIDKMKKSDYLYKIERDLVIPEIEEWMDANS